MAANKSNILGDYFLLKKKGENCRYSHQVKKKEKEGKITMEEEMEIRGEAEMSRGMKRWLLVINCIMLATGISGGPLIMRLYYLHGGKSIWLSACLETGGWPIMIFPFFYSYFQRRKIDPSSKLFLIKPAMILYAVVIGFVAGFGDFVYAYGVKHIPVSTSSLILATQLAFTAGFAWILVGQKFTAYSVNAVALLTFGALVLALHTSSDRPEGVTSKQYYIGFFFTLMASASFALMLPLVERVYKTSKDAVTYPLVIEIQTVLSFSATSLCTVGMFVAGDYKTYAAEIRGFEMGAAAYILILIANAIMWQFFYLGAVGAIYYGSSLLSGVVIALSLPVTEIMAVIFYHEKFQVEKGVSLILSLWGFVSYFYGEAKMQKKREKKDMETNPV